MHQIQLSIPEPCHENWDAMTPTQQGRFCNACAKQVVDFSTMTDTQVLNYFSNIKNEKVCGRAYPDQLERAIVLPKEPKKRLFWHWNYITMLFLFFSKTNNAKAQGGVQVVTTADQNKQKPVNVNEALAGKVAGPTIYSLITGRISDQNGNPIPFAYIQITNTDKKINADANGNYSVKVTTALEELEISAMGYKTKTFCLKNSNSFDFVLEQDEHFRLGEMVVSSVKKGKSAISNNNIIAGKVKDQNGNAVSFALIKIKGTEARLLADINGEFSIKADIRKDTLQVAGIGYLTQELPLDKLQQSSQSIIQLDKDIVLQQASMGGIKIQITRDNRTKHIAIFKVKDNATMQPVSKASLIIARIGENKSNAVAADKEGVFKLKEIKKGEVYIIKIFAEGYINQELQIDANDFDERKISKEIFLEKQPVASDFKKLDAVIVTSYGMIKRSCTTGAVSVVKEQKVNQFKDSVNVIVSKLTGTLKVYPNPIQKGSAFKIEFKIKQAGNYTIEIIDAAGRIVLQKQSTVMDKRHTEELPTENNWSSGTYFIRILDKTGALISINKFVVN